MLLNTWNMVESKNVRIQSIDDTYNYTLINGDIVEFKSEIFDINCTYVVCSTHLALLGKPCIVKQQETSLNDYMSNSYIFDKLKINSYQFCENHYGYKPDIMAPWPRTHYGDYRALTRVVKEIYATIKKMEEDVIRSTHIDAGVTLLDTVTDISGSILIDNTISAVTTNNDYWAPVKTTKDYVPDFYIHDADLFQCLKSVSSYPIINQTNDNECSNNELEKDDHKGKIKIKPIKSDIKRVNCDKEIKIKF